MDDESREEIIEALIGVLDDHHGTLPDIAVTHLVESTGRSRPTIFRWAREARARRAGTPPAQRSRRLRLTRHQRRVLAASPDLTKGYEDLLIADPNLGSYWRVWRAVQRLTPGERAVISGNGPVDMDRMEIKVPHRVAEINELNVIDHYLMDFLVVPEGTKRVERFWATCLMDEHSRLIKNADIYPGAPNAVRTVAIIAGGVMRHALDGVEIGGLFERLHHDNGKELTGEYKDQFERQLKLFSSANPAYSPGWDGKIEAFHKDISRSFCARFPGTTIGPRYHFNDELAKQPFVPRKLGQFPTEAEAREAFFAWVDDRNRNHRYTELDERTPLEEWKASDVPLRFPRDDEVLRALLDTGTRRVDHRGVQHKGAFYRSTELNRVVGRRGLVRYLPNDPSHIWVFVDNKPILAWHEDVVPTEEDDRLLRRRQYERRRANELTREAAELLNERFAQERAQGRPLPLSAVELPRRRKVSSEEEIEAFDPQADSGTGRAPASRTAPAVDEDSELEAFEQ